MLATLPYITMVKRACLDATQNPEGAKGSTAATSVRGSRNRPAHLILYRLPSPASCRRSGEISRHQLQPTQRRGRAQRPTTRASATGTSPPMDYGSSGMNPTVDVARAVDVVWMFVCFVLVILMQGGFACYEVSSRIFRIVRACRLLVDLVRSLSTRRTPHDLRNAVTLWCSSNKGPSFRARVRRSIAVRCAPR